MLWQAVMSSLCLDALEQVWHARQCPGVYMGEALREVCVLQISFSCAGVLICILQFKNDSGRAPRPSLTYGVKETAPYGASG